MSMARKSRHRAASNPDPAANGAVKPVGQLFDELREMVTDYVRQETVEPAKNLGRAFAFSLLGGTTLGGGFCMLLLGTLRLLQSEVWVFPKGGYSWAPYVITGVVGIVVVVVTLMLARGRTNGAT
jgi:hypothetical protein